MTSSPRMPALALMTVLADRSPLLAHQYGWDEILVFLVPIVLALAGVRYAERRAARRRSEHDEAERG